MLMMVFMRYPVSGIVGAIDGSLVPIIAPINASVHPPHEYGVTCHLSSFVFLLFLLPSASESVHFIFNSNNSDALHHAAVALSHISDLIWLVIGLTLPNNSVKSSKSSAHLHSYYYLPLLPMITLVMLI